MHGPRRTGHRNAGKELDRTWRKIFKLHLARQEQLTAGEDAPLADRVGKLADAIGTEALRINKIEKEWTNYRDTLFSKIGSNQTEIYRAIGSKNDLKADLSELRELLKRLPDLPDNPGTITSKEAEAAKALEDAEKAVGSAIESQFAGLKKLSELLVRLAGKRNPDRPFDETADLSEPDVERARKFSLLLKENVDRFETDLTEFESGVDKLGKQKTSDVVETSPSGRKADPLPEIQISEVQRNVTDHARTDHQEGGLDFIHHNLVPIVNFGVGVNVLGQNQIRLPAFNQFLEAPTGTVFTGGAGFILPRVFLEDGDLKFSVEVDQKKLWIDELGNELFPGVLPLTGDIESIGVRGRVDIEWNINDNGGRTIIRPGVGISGGLAFQKLTARSNGVVVLKGNATRPTVSGHAGFKVPLTNAFAMGVEGYVSWTEGFKVTAGPNVTSRIADRIETGFFLKGEVQLGQIFTDGFESGNTSAWSVKRP